MKKQISIAILLMATILFNGCYSTSYMQKAPSKESWDKSAKFQTCDDSQMPIALYRFYSYSNMTAGGLNAFTALAISGGSTTLAIGALQFMYGGLQAIDASTANDEAQKCSDYKTFMLSK